MLLLVLNVLFVLIAIAMVALILMQRGSGAAAGSGFGGGASATVFGARGSSSFLTKATKWLAIGFFAITLFMAWHATRQAAPQQVQQDLGVMSVPQAPPADAGSVPAAPGQQPDASVPAAPATESPALPEAPAGAAGQQQAPAPAQEDEEQ
ncbi:preprotein translocase subunit SecG [Luteimonas sp. R10]|uniref:preprotein translocase subunit SecG n=1 Tax=Luteimonas sp. R10 TaxID=3108176 RepID=UPI00308C957B|nr:preprotein translocase subunit SecG [Luteimonas sp. R10]